MRALGSWLRLWRQHPPLREQRGRRGWRLASWRWWWAWALWGCWRWRRRASWAPPRCWRWTLCRSGWTWRGGWAARQSTGRCATRWLLSSERWPAWRACMPPSCRGGWAAGTGCRCPAPRTYCRRPHRAQAARHTRGYVWRAAAAELALRARWRPSSAGRPRVGAGRTRRWRWWAARRLWDWLSNCCDPGARSPLWAAILVSKAAAAGRRSRGWPAAGPCTACWPVPTHACTTTAAEPSWPFTPVDAYNKNLTLRSGRCPARWVWMGRAGAGRRGRRRDRWGCRRGGRRAAWFWQQRPFMSPTCNVPMCL